MELFPSDTPANEMSAAVTVSVMSMGLEEYESIVAAVYNKQTSVNSLCKQFPQYSTKTISSIFSQEIQRKTKRTHHCHHTARKMDEYYFRYCERSQMKRRPSNVLLRISQEVDLPPTLLARIIVDRYLMYSEYDGEPPPRNEVTRYLKNTCLINDPVLALEIDVCNTCDEVYGPIVDAIKHAVGEEQEKELKDRLDKAAVSYQAENVLRAKGYDKTPDFKLEIPLLVDGHVVNWIESKASFGDPDSHKGYLNDQYWSYYNRFGSGLVIYWFGFVKELDNNRDKGIILTDHFPEKFVSLDHLLEDTATSK